MIGKIDHIVPKLLRSHSGKGSRDKVIFSKALWMKGLALGISMVAHLLHGIALFFRRLVGRIIQHAVHGQAIVDIDRCFLTEDSAVHIEGGDTVCRLQIVRTRFICHAGNEIHQFGQ